MTFESLGKRRLTAELRNFFETSQRRLQIRCRILTALRGWSSSPNRPVISLLSSASLFQCRALRIAD
jgi:hypothetical protein